MQMLGWHLKTAYENFRPLPSKFIIHNHPRIQCYVTYVNEKRFSWGDNIKTNHKKYGESRLDLSGSEHGTIADFHELTTWSRDVQKLRVH
jgi:hypothetical protein